MSNILQADNEKSAFEGARLWLTADLLKETMDVSENGASMCWKKINPKHEFYIQLKCTLERKLE